MDRKLLILNALTAGAMAWGGAAAAATPSAPAPLLPAPAAGPVFADDRQVLQTFLAGVPVTQRRLLADLDRTQWTPAEIRAALAKVYAVQVEKVALFLDSSAGKALIEQQLQGWSPWTPAPLKAYGLRSAILTASRQEALSVAGVVAAMPVRFVLPQTAAEAHRPISDPVCPPQCGDSVLAHLAFLIASVQVGAMGR